MTWCECVCGHHRGDHFRDGWQYLGCGHCIRCDKPGDAHVFVGHRFVSCPCDLYQENHVNDALRDAAARAVVFQVLEQAAKQHKDAAKAELAQLEAGDTIAGRWDGQLLGKATKTTGRTKLVVTDEGKLLEWLQRVHPTEIVVTPNPAYLKQIEDNARAFGEPVDRDGELVPGVELQHGDPYISVRREKDAPFIVAQLLSAGRVSLEGIREIEE